MTGSQILIGMGILGTSYTIGKISTALIIAKKEKDIARTRLLAEQKREERWRMIWKERDVEIQKMLEEIKKLIIFPHSFLE